MKRQILSVPAKLVVFTSFSLLLSAQLRASPPSILDDPAMASGGSILSDPVPLCDSGLMATYEGGVDIYGRPVVPADTTAPIVLDGASDVIVPEIYNPAKGTERIRLQLELKGLAAATEPVPCQPAPGRKSR